MCDRACVYAYVRVCVRECVCTCVYVCTYVCMGVLAYVCVCERAEGEKEKYVLADLPGFCGSVVSAECLPRVHNYCHIWKVLTLVDQLCWKIVPVSPSRLP